jgi:hypothetical protein
MDSGEMMIKVLKKEYTPTNKEALYLYALAWDWGLESILEGVEHDEYEAQGSSGLKELARVLKLSEKEIAEIEAHDEPDFSQYYNPEK